MTTTAIILAAGLGTRMNTELPKVLHKVGDEPMLGRVISGLKKAGIKDMIAVVGYKREVIESFFKHEVRFVFQRKRLGSGDAVKQAVNKLSDSVGNVLVTCGDTPLIEAAAYRGIMKKHSSQRVSCTLLTACAEDPFSYGRIIRDEKGGVIKIVEEKDASNEEKKIKEINAGVYCFRKQDLEKFIHKIKINKKKKEFYLTDIIELLAKNGKKIVSEECSVEEIIGINSRKDLVYANRIINDKTLARLMKRGVTIIDTSTIFISEKADIAKDTIIYPNTIIEKDVVIGKSCQIGPFARLRPGTILQDEVEVGNFVELCRTKVGRKTKIKHHAYLGDTEVGSHVNIGAGVITANYDGKNKLHTIIEDRAFVGVGAILIAPVKIGKNAVVGAGSVVTKNKNVPAGKTVIGVPAKIFEKFNLVKI